MALKLKKLLVANRGEIAIRIFRTARELGLKTVAVYSDEDAQSAHRFEADESICIGPAESALSYLNIEAILNAAKKTSADGIHPGYGFLSEKEKFAEAVEKAALKFVGPSSAHIAAMGDKVAAREKMRSLGVPVVPGTQGFEDLKTGLQLVEKLEKESKDFCYPLLVKASGGGGGKGMRLVRKPSELAEALERAQSESVKAFSNALIFVERFIEEPRHIEVQVLGDGNTGLHLFERECSLQRRHQKVVEEALSPSLGASAREAMLKTAADAITQMGYKSAGTLEFIVSKNDEYYFLEMNTRIQVEHPVTEGITGKDLVAEQIRIASDLPISFAQNEITPRGHAIEARLYAEDALRQFLPQAGVCEKLDFPHWPSVRVDSAFKSTGKVSRYYDPMIAKVISWGSDRDQARSKLLEFLKATRVQGVITNKSFLISILESEYFKKGRYHTGVLEDSSWKKPTRASEEVLAAACLIRHFDSKWTEENNQLSAWQQSELV